VNLRGPTSKGREGERRGEGKGEGIGRGREGVEGKGRDGRKRTPQEKSWLRACSTLRLPDIYHTFQ